MDELGFEVEDLGVEPPAGNGVGNRLELGVGMADVVRHADDGDRGERGCIEVADLGGGRVVARPDAFEDGLGASPRGA